MDNNEQLQEENLSEIEKLELEKQKLHQQFEDKAISIGADDYLVFKNDNGKYIAAFLKKPSYIVSIRALDYIQVDKSFQAGNELFSTCFMREHSDRECEDVKYKTAIVARLSRLLEVATPEFKKNRKIFCK